MLILEELCEGGVLGVSIQGHHVLVVAAQLGQSHAVRLPRRDLLGRTHKRTEVSSPQSTETGGRCCTELVRHRRSHLLSKFVVWCAGHADVAEADWRGVLVGRRGIEALVAADDAALQLLDHALGHVLRQRLAVPAIFILSR